MCGPRVGSVGADCSPGAGRVNAPAAGDSLTAGRPRAACSIHCPEPTPQAPMKILFWSDPGGSSGGPGHYGPAYFNGLRKYFPECVGGFAFPDSAEERELYA